MKVHRVPDLSKRLLLGLEDKNKMVPLGPKGSMPVHEETLRELIRVPIDTEAEPTNLSPEQRAIATARRWALDLVTNDERVRQTVAAMAAFRRCYVVAYRELQESIAAHPGADAMTEDCLIMSAMELASRPFSEHELMQSFVDSVLPWIAEVVDTHTEHDAKLEQEAMIQDENDRRERPVPIGFHLSVESPSASVERGRSLVFAGWSNAVLFVLDQIANAVLTARDGQTYCLLRLHVYAPKKSDQHNRLIRLAPNQWAGCCNTGDSLLRCLGAHVAERLTQPLDVIMADDMCLAFNKSFVGRPKAANAGDANKRFRGWCKDNGALFVGGILSDEKQVLDIRTPDYEQIRTFATVRTVSVLEETAGLAAGKVRVGVAGSLHFWDVDKEVLAGYGHGNIIAPA